MNNQKKYHIGFCGENSEEIYDTLINDFSDLELKDSFLVAYDNSSIVGAIGLDIDLRGEYADVWGPFVKEGDMEIATELWKKLVQNVPNGVKKFSFFMNEENTFVKNFALQNKGISQGSDLVLQMTSDKPIDRNVNGLENFSDKHRVSFTNLHNEVFPKTYFDAKTILSRLNDHNRLILVKENESDIKGYIYVEANPEHWEGNIEYVAVSKKFRKEGIGKLLIIGAVNQLFSYRRIEEITICVGADNTPAVNLYQSVGFEEKYKLISYEVINN